MEEAIFLSQGDPKMKFDIETNPSAQSPKLTLNFASDISLVDSNHSLDSNCSPSLSPSRKDMNVRVFENPTPHPSFQTKTHKYPPQAIPKELLAKLNQKFPSTHQELDANLNYQCTAECCGLTKLQEVHVNPINTVHSKPRSMIFPTSGQPLINFNVSSDRQQINPERDFIISEKYQQLFNESQRNIENSERTNELHEDIKRKLEAKFPNLVGSDDLHKFYQHADEEDTDSSDDSEMSDFEFPDMFEDFKGLKFGQETVNGKNLLDLDLDLRCEIFDSPIFYSTYYTTPSYRNISGKGCY